MHRARATCTPHGRPPTEVKRREADSYTPHGLHPAWLGWDAGRRGAADASHRTASGRKLGGWNMYCRPFAEVGWYCSDLVGSMPSPNRQQWVVNAIMQRARSGLKSIANSANVIPHVRNKRKILGCCGLSTNRRRWFSCRLGLGMLLTNRKR